SFAAPRVARAAALVWEHLREALDEGPDPNLVRAVLATAAVEPQALRDRICPARGEDNPRRVCGYGAIAEDFALNTADRRVKRQLEREGSTDADLALDADDRAVQLRHLLHDGEAEPGGAATLGAWACLIEALEDLREALAGDAAARIGH